MNAWPFIQVGGCLEEKNLFLITRLENEMTTIVGIQGDGFTILCSDSRISTVDDDGYVSYVQTLSPSMSKIAQVGPYLIGIAGDLRAINLINYAFQPPIPPAAMKGRKLDEFITLKFVSALRECFDSNGYSPPPKESSDHVAQQGSSIIISVNRMIYQIDNDYAWTTDASGLYAIGTGTYYALGALNILCPKMPTLTQAKRHVLKALSTASKYDPHTGHPYKTYVQDSTSIKVRKAIQ
jgi:20S proteasome alpha/beta subunit